MLGTKSSIGIFDCAVLMALLRKFAPTVCVETGGNLGMSSSFILPGMHEAGVKAGKLYSVEVDPNIPGGLYDFREIKGRFIPLIGDVKKYPEVEIHESGAFERGDLCPLLFQMTSSG